MKKPSWHANTWKSLPVFPTVLVVVLLVLHLPSVWVWAHLGRVHPLAALSSLSTTFICHCWVVVLVTTGDTFHNGLKQSLWKQSFWFAINNPPPGYICVHCAWDKLTCTEKCRKEWKIWFNILKLMCMTFIFTVSDIWFHCQIITFAEEKSINLPVQCKINLIQF